VYETSNKLNKIGLKKLYLCISKYERLNWSKILKLTNSKIQHKRKKTYLTIELTIGILAKRRKNKNLIQSHTSTNLHHVINSTSSLFFI